MGCIGKVHGACCNGMVHGMVRLASALCKVPVHDTLTWCTGMVHGHGGSCTLCLSVSLSLYIYIYIYMYFIIIIISIFLLLYIYICLQSGSAPWLILLVYKDISYKGPIHGELFYKDLL